jgi:hypothetical protein
MQLFKNNKDRILDALVNNCCVPNNNEIGIYLNIPNYTVYTLLIEMAERGHIEVIDKTSIGTTMKSCMVRQIYPQAYHFHKHHRYWNEEFWKKVERAPKRYWALLSVIGFFVGTILGPTLQERWKTIIQQPSKKVNKNENNAKSKINK